MLLPDISPALAALPVLRCAFRLRAEESVSLPPFVGSTLRGAFGAALKSAVCRVPPGECESCWFIEACAYPYIFETGALDDEALPRLHPQLYKQQDLPHPYTFVPPPLIARKGGREASRATAKERRHPPNLNNFFARYDLRAGDELNFGMTFIGRGARLWQFAFVAALLMARAGLGEANAPFTLTHAATFDEFDRMKLLFSEGAPRLRAAQAAPRTLLSFVEARRAQISTGERARLRFFTPARIVQHGKLDTRIEFKTLIAKLTQRIEHLAALHAEPPRHFDLREIVARAEGIEIKEAQWKEFLWERHSNRQGRKVARHVLYGEVEYAGANISEFFPLLAAGEVLQVGAATSDGLGIYRMIE
jgi:hypothetical protein